VTKKIQYTNKKKVIQDGSREFFWLIMRVTYEVYPQRREKTEY